MTAGSTGHLKPILAASIAGPSAGSATRLQLTPRVVMNDSARYGEQYPRTWHADLTNPIILCDRAGKRPMILDGVHRILKAVLLVGG